ncbi:hypothetical protein [Streptomyces coeruleorubidus]|uniref:hypothetical protein n=1 Tax=Streptomyces coeruleorubidus TaxID=116188 RepID=UPI0019A386A4|nr:hypothetical protein [Streptomyces coeruleorubidus]GGT63217.1 hypothetical protein GCM10010256_20900 [Streptomyces coeruleorubidus]
MTTVVMHNVVSVDGFIADADDQVGPLFDWYGNGHVQLNEYATVSRASADYLLEDPHTVIQGDRVLHLRYRVRKQP